MFRPKKSERGAVDKGRRGNQAGKGQQGQWGYGLATERVGGEHSRSEEALTRSAAD